MKHPQLSAETVALREQAPFGEKQDCCVFAVAHACDLTYGQAHSLLKDAGRRDRCGFGMHQWANHTVRIVNGYWFRWVDLSTFPRMNQTEVLDFLGQGRYIVSVPHHVYSVVNGDVVDIYPVSRRRPIRGVWELVQREGHNGYWPKREGNA